jgi:hypothetical protein
MLLLDRLINKVYTFNDIPKKKQYLLTRLKEIYPTTDENEIIKIIDAIKIKFREQNERGASNHKTLTVFLPIHDFKKNFIKSQDDVISYLENPKSTITHETIHIFQNLAKDFPHVEYLKQNPDGDYEIDYEKYWNDSGEKQSRLEQVRELLEWGFTKHEILYTLYNRKHDDRDLWERIIDKAIELRKHQKTGG